jgi:hypothetical protein
LRTTVSSLCWRSSKCCSTRAQASACKCKLKAAKGSGSILAIKTWSRCLDIIQVVIPSNLT